MSKKTQNVKQVINWKDSVIIASIISGLFLLISSAFLMVKCSAEHPHFTVENPLTNPNGYLLIHAANNKAEKLDSLDIRLDGIEFRKLAIPIPGTEPRKWKVSLNRHDIFPELKSNGHHTISILHGKGEENKLFYINSKAPIVSGTIVDSNNENSKKLNIKTASHMQIACDTLYVQIMIATDSDSFATTELIGSKKIDPEKSLVYYEFECEIEKPEITKADKKYDETFIGIKATDSFGNSYRFSESYAKFIAPGKTTFGVGNIADISVYEPTKDTFPQNSNSIKITVKPNKKVLESEQLLILTVVQGHDDTRVLIWERKYEVLGNSVVNIYKNNKKVGTASEADTKFVDDSKLLHEQVEYAITEEFEDGYLVKSNIEKYPEIKNVNVNLHANYNSSTNQIQLNWEQVENIYSYRIVLSNGNSNHEIISDSCYCFLDVYKYQEKQTMKNIINPFIRGDSLLCKISVFPIGFNHKLKNNSIYLAWKLKNIDKTIKKVPSLSYKKFLKSFAETIGDQPYFYSEKDIVSWYSEIKNSKLISNKEISNYISQKKETVPIPYEERYNCALSNFKPSKYNDLTININQLDKFNTSMPNLPSKHSIHSLEFEIQPIKHRYFFEAELSAELRHKTSYMPLVMGVDLNDIYYNEDNGIIKIDKQKILEFLEKAGTTSLDYISEDDQCVLFAINKINITYYIFIFKNTAEIKFNIPYYILIYNMQLMATLQQMFLR